MLKRNQLFLTLAQQLKNRDQNLSQDLNKSRNRMPFPQIMVPEIFSMVALWLFMMAGFITALWKMVIYRNGNLIKCVLMAATNNMSAREAIILVLLMAGFISVRIYRSMVYFECGWMEPN